GRDPWEAPTHPLADDLDLIDWRPRHDGIGDVVVMQVLEQSLEMVDFQGATHALRDLVWSHHEVLDEELTAPVEQFGKRDLAFRRIENVFLLNLHPRQLAPVVAEFIAQPRDLFFSLE